MLGIINLEISNLTSVLNALEYVSINYIVIEKTTDFFKVNKIILPGVGTFAAGMTALKEKGFYEHLCNAVLDEKRPILGICLGQQLLFSSSEESPEVNGLDFLKGKVVKIPKNSDYNIPRVGWAESAFRKDFFSFNVGDKEDFYYIHSYSVQPVNDEVIAVITEANGIVGAVSFENIYGCQFHPEKSHSNGLRILKNFAEL